MYENKKYDHKCDVHSLYIMQTFPQAYIKVLMNRKSITAVYLKKDLGLSNLPFIHTSQDILTDPFTACFDTFLRELIQYTNTKSCTDVF